jgi:hypothetical protein
MTETIVKRQKAKSKGFSVLGVPLGATLTFRKDPSITCVVVDGKNKVEYLGETYLISGLAKKLMNSPISGYHAFKYNGVLLAKLGETSDDAPVSANNPTETAQVAQQATTIAHSPVHPLTAAPGSLCTAF